VGKGKANDENIGGIILYIKQIKRKNDKNNMRITKSNNSHKMLYTNICWMKPFELYKWAKQTQANKQTHANKKIREIKNLLEEVENVSTKWWQKLLDIHNW